MVAVVQVTPVAADFNSVLNHVFPAPVASGNTVVSMQVIGNGNQPVVSVIDDQSNSYTFDAELATLTGNDADLFFYRRAAITNGADTVTWTTTTGGGVRGMALELSGVNASTPLGTSGRNDGTSDTATLAITTPSNNEAIIVYIETAATSTVTEGAYTQVAWDGSEPSSAHTLYLADAGAAGVKNLSFSFGSSVQWTISAISYRTATGGIEGDLDATESGADVVAATGSVGSNGIRLTLRDTDTGALAASLTGLIVSIRADSDDEATLAKSASETTDGSGVLELASGAIGNVGDYVYVTVEKSDNSIVATYRVQVIDLNA